MIAVVDYGLGNLGSIANMLKKIGAPAEVTSDPDRLISADKLILPGVGAFDAGMERLRGSGLLDVLTVRVREQGAPLLGICLGAQLLTRRSEEGELDGLGWIEADTVRFDAEALGSSRKIPNMGWNEVRVSKSSPLFTDFPEEPRFYFVHSYYVKLDELADQLTSSVYGIEYTSAYERGNIAGVQFHPEKSHRFGKRLLANFAGSSS